MANIPNAQFDQITGSMAELQSNSDGPNFLELERRLLSDDFSFIPWGVLLTVACSFHVELL
jgi:hypothetical protein